MGDFGGGPSRGRLRALGIEVLVDVLESMPDACTLSEAVRDTDGRARDMRLLWMNARARAGQPDPEAAIGGLCSELWPGMIANGSFAACMRVLDTGEAESGEFDWTESDNYKIAGYEYRALRIGKQLLLWVLRDDTGRVRRMITAQKERELLERKLRQSQKMEVVGRLAAGVAHDFNNLLTIMLGSCGELAQTVATGAASERVQDLHDAAQRAAGLTRRLLAFSRQQVETPTDVDVNLLVRDVGRLLHRLLGEDIELTLELDATGCVVHADRGLLEQAVLNLAVNARDAMPTGGKLVIATQVLTRAEGTFVRLTVSDTGMGMDESVRARLFEPFFTTKAPGLGTGLGLAMVKGVVDTAHGKIEVESAVGRGTRFELTFPRVPSAAPVVELVTPKIRPARGEVVLLAEDEPGVRTLTIRILTRYGYQVISAGTGLEAERIAETHAGRLDALVTDVVLPKLSGRELAERMRVRRPELRVLFVSGYTDDELLRRGVLPSGTAFLAKPFAAADLAQRLGTLLDERMS